jgi:hypothetical protein
LHWGKYGFAHFGGILGKVFHAEEPLLHQLASTGLVANELPFDLVADILGDIRGVVGNALDMTHH